MTFKEDIRNRQKAGAGAVIVVTNDETACLRQLRDSLAGELHHWNTAMGWTILDENHEQQMLRGGNDDDTVKGVFDTFLSQLHSEKPLGTRLHQQVRVFMGVDSVMEQSGNARRLLLESARGARVHEQGVFAVVITGAAEIHPELREIPVLHHPLPTYDETVEAMREWEREHSEDGLRVRFDGAEARAAKMLVGLSETQQMDALSLALAESKERKGKEPFRELPIDVLRRFKETEVAKLGYLRIKTPEKKLSDLVGHEDLKKWVVARREAFSNDAYPSPKGVILAGPPGTGKSRIVEGFAAELGFSLLEFDMGAVFSKWLGESDAQMRRALEIAQRMAPCIFYVDEADTAFGNTGDNDGTARRILGKFQTWMASSDREGVFVVFTSNFPQRLPAALTRKGRFNETFSMDFPTLKEREDIFAYYAKGDLSADDISILAAKTKNWAPAEIEAVIEEARLQCAVDKKPLDKEEVTTQIGLTTPVSKSMAEEIKVMREWAEEFARPTTNKKELEEDVDWSYVDDDE